MYCTLSLDPYIAAMRVFSRPRFNSTFSVDTINYKHTHHPTPKRNAQTRDFRITALPEWRIDQVNRLLPAGEPGIFDHENFSHTVCFRRRIKYSAQDISRSIFGPGARSQAHVVSFGSFPDNVVAKDVRVTQILQFNNDMSYCRLYQNT